MRVKTASLGSPVFGARDVIAYGHWGRPVLVFPSQSGRALDFAGNGMLDAVSGLVRDGRVKLYCVDSYDDGSWSDRSLPTEERARRHGAYESWLLEAVLPFVYDDCGGPRPVVATGPSLGAWHAVNLALRRADLIPVAIGLSGNYDPTSWRGWGETGDATYFHNPTAYVAGFDGGHLDWLRSSLHLVLCVGQGAFEVSPTRALPSTEQLASLLASKGISHDLDVWGPDTPHDWPSWQRQLALHLPRFC